MDSILGQDFVDFDVVVVDNNSDDDTFDIVRSYDDSRVRLFRNTTTLPMAENWNRVIGLATSDLVKLVCADDLIAPQCLSIQVDTMRNSNVALVSSMFDVVDDNGVTLATGLGAPQLLGFHTSNEVGRTFVRKLPDDIGPSAAFMFRRQDVVKTIGFRPDFEYSFDIDLWARLSKNGLFFGHSESLAINRASTFNYSSRTSSLSKFTDIVRFNHAMVKELSGIVSPFDAMRGDLRVGTAACRRLRSRLCGAV